MAGKTTTKYFRIGTEGATTDGRNIERAWLEQAAKNYNPATYGARVDLEHIKGIDPSSLFKAYGDVLALKTAEIDINGEKKLTLLAQIDPTPELVALTKARQKIYTSMEIAPKFADTEEAYLVGLAITDNPASLGTEMLQFAAQSGALKARKQNPDNLFSAATEASIEFEVREVEPNLLERVKALFTKRDQNADARFADVHAAVEVVATHQTTQGDKVAQLEGKVTALTAQATKQGEALATLQAKLDTTPNFTQRQPATGGNGSGVIETDC
jgi:hypothetical protein